MLLNGNCLLGASCFVPDRFDNFTSGQDETNTFIIVAVVVAVVLAVATHRLVPSNKLLHSVLTLLFGVLWVMLIWFYYAFFTKRRLK